MIQLKFVFELTEQELARCRELSYGDEGYMCDELDAELGGGNNTTRPALAHLYYIDEVIVAWALLTPIYGVSKYNVQIFVHPQYRRRGIGTELLKSARQWSRFRPEVYIDSSNYGFFEKTKDIHSCSRHLQIIRAASLRPSEKEENEDIKV